MEPPSAGSGEQVNLHLRNFDQLDFEAFSKQDWDLLDTFHAADVVVTFPDGRQTHGIADHDRDLQAMFTWAPDMQIVAHPIKFGSGDMTAVTGILTGTFLKPMRLANGGILMPTGRRFTIPMCTVARWQDGKIVEENLFWDTGAMLRQIGLETEPPDETPIIAEMREDF